MSNRCLKGSLPFISLLDSNQMISISEVQFSEGVGALDWFKSRGESWQGVFILYRDPVQTSIVYAGPERTIFLPHKKKPCTDRRGGVVNDASCQGFVDALLNALTFRLGKAEQSARREWYTRKKVYGTVIWAMGW